jgi:hypothetical protein
MRSNILDDYRDFLAWLQTRTESTDALTQSFVAFNTLQHSGLLNRPLSNVGPLLRGGLVLRIFFRMTDFPPRVPVFGELFVEWSGNSEGLKISILAIVLFDCDSCSMGYYRKCGLLDACRGRRRNGRRGRGSGSITEDIVDVVSVSQVAKAHESNGEKPEGHVPGETHCE